MGSGPLWHFQPLFCKYSVGSSAVFGIFSLDSEVQFCAMAADNNNMIWVTWKDNRSRYDGKTHLVPRDVVIDPPTPLIVGTLVPVYWETGRKKY